MKSGVCIVECVDAKDPGSEGRFLREALNLMCVDSVLVRVKSIERLLEALSETDFEFAHVATHGRVTRDDKFKGWWTGNGDGTKRLFQRLNPRTSCTAIVSTACGSGAAGFARHVVGDMGAESYIAPTGHPYFHNAALFTHVYYHKLFRTKGTVRDAFKSYASAYKNPHRFKLYTRDAA